MLSWQPDNLALMLPGSLSDALATGQPQFVPRLDTIMVLLSRRVTAASAWAHLLTVNSFAARYVFLNARARRVPAVRSTTSPCASMARRSCMASAPML